MTKVRTGVWRCRGGFAGPGSLFVADGTLVPRDMPYDVMDGREALFENVEEAPAPVEGVIEQATKAPGEKRSTRPKVTKSAESDAVVDGGS